MLLGKVADRICPADYTRSVTPVANADDTLLRTAIVVGFKHFEGGPIGFKNDTNVAIGAVITAA